MKVLLVNRGKMIKQDNSGKQKNMKKQTSKSMFVFTLSCFHREFYINY